MASVTKFFFEAGPLVAFFLIYRLYGLIPATATLIAITALSVTINYLKTRKIAFVPLASALLLSFFGGMTLLSGDHRFIQMKPTIINLLFASILLIGTYYQKGFLKYILGEALTLQEQAWLTLSKRWGFFFLLLAILNEIIWRHCSEEMWVQFKVFGIFPLTLLFTLTQIPYILRHRKE